MPNRAEILTSVLDVPQKIPLDFSSNSGRMEMGLLPNGYRVNRSKGL